MVGAVSKRSELRRALERMLSDRAAATIVVELVFGMSPVGVLRLRLSLQHTRRVVDEAPVRAGTHARIRQAHGSKKVLGSTAIEQPPLARRAAAVLHAIQALEKYARPVQRARGVADFVGS